ncbi:MAG: fibronectin type III domain-containing protein [Eubacterium sp.]|nr:fibronectin type III domain-containing protein [Eubacterium sp.]
MKRLLSVALSLVMVMTALFTLPFSVQAASYTVNATTVIYVTSWEELNAALTDGEANKTIVLSNDIQADPTGEYDNNLYDEYYNLVEQRDDVNYMITPNINGVVVIDMNGHSLTLGDISGSTYFYEVVAPKMFNLTEQTDLYIVNSKSTKGSLTMSTKNRATLVNCQNGKAGFHIIADSQHPVSVLIDAAHTDGKNSRVVYIENSNGEAYCKMAEFIGVKIELNSYNSSVIDIRAATAMNTPVVFGGGSSVKFDRTGSRFAYLYRTEKPGNMALYDCSFEYGSSASGPFVQYVNNTSGSVTLGNLFDSSYAGNYTVTNAGKNDSVFDINSSFSIGINYGGAAINNTLSTYGAHFKVNNTKTLKTVSTHSLSLYDEKDATCVEDGYIDKKCSECEQIIREVRPALGHDWTAVTTVAPTCVNDGYTNYRCSRCTETKTDDITAATGVHDFGENAKTCKICGADNPNYVEPVSPLQPAEKKPAATKITKLTAGKKQFTVKWAKKKGIKGYQIQYSLKKSMKGAKIKTVKGAAKTKATIKKLKKGKKYYVRVRTYKVVSGKKVPSKWSAKKSVKVK